MHKQYKTIANFDNKALKAFFKMIKKGVVGGISTLYIVAFLLKIKPIADRYGWAINWGMGSVDFETKDGRSLTPYDRINVSKVLDKMSDELEEMFGKEIPVSGEGHLWDIMCSLGEYNRYSKEHGLQLITSTR